MLNYLHRVFILLLLASSLISCGGGGGGDGGGGGQTSANAVTYTADTSATGVLVGQPRTINLTFNSNTDVATNLTVKLDNPPSGWSAPSIPFRCDTVSASSNACQLSLTYEPTAATTEKTLELNYSYTDSAMGSKSETARIKYSAISAPPSPFPLGFQYSSGDRIGDEYGVTLTSSGVQVYGKSTSDLAVPIIDRGNASGLELASGGLAAVGLDKESSGNIRKIALLLDNIGISWDNRTQRPTIVETFNENPGRVVLGADGTISDVALPPSSDLAFYDFATLGTLGTQSNYANNCYFPRDEASRCDTPPCKTLETTGIQSTPGDWRSGGSSPDNATASRLHGDGDIHAGNATDGGWLPGGNGIGVPFPGSKGYREFNNWSYQYSNLISWVTQDTVQIAEWTGANGADEHNQNRRGLVAFGQVTDPALVPASGSARYSGVVHGRFASSSASEPETFSGTATIEVNFATRTATVTIRSEQIALNIVDLAAQMGESLTNYLTGSISDAAWSGRLSSRLFGPASSNDPIPAELGGVFRLTGTSGAVVIGGFIARRQ